MSLIPGRTFLDANRLVQNHFVTATLADINAGLSLLPPVSGVQYAVTGIHILVNGAFTTLTDIRISTDEASPTDILTIVQAQLGDGVKHSHLTGTNTLGAAFWAALALGYGVQVRKTGSTGAGGTSLTIRLEYKVIKPS